MLMVGEQFDGDDNEGVCGAVVQNRAKGDRVAIWTRDASNGESVMRIGYVFAPFSIRPVFVFVFDLHCMHPMYSVASANVSMESTHTALTHSLLCMYAVSQGEIQGCHDVGQGYSVSGAHGRQRRQRCGRINQVYCLVRLNFYVRKKKVERPCMHLFLPDCCRLPLLLNNPAHTIRRYTPL